MSKLKTNGLVIVALLVSGILSIVTEWHWWLCAVIAYGVILPFAILDIRRARRAPGNRVEADIGHR